MTYIYQKNADDLYLDLQSRMRQAGVTNSYPDALANVINDFITEELSNLSSEFNSRLGDFSLVNASGEALDNLVNEMYGFSRFAATKASCNQSIEITNLSSEEIVIEKGTLISGGLTFDDSGIVYELSEEYTIDEEDSVFASAIALEPGSFYNVEADYLTQIELSDVNLTIRNLYPIVNGSDIESDDLFRTRALLYLTSVTSNNLDFLKLKLLEIPGVFNIRYIQGYNGLGTIGVFGTTAGYKTNSELKQMIEMRLLELKTPGSAIFYEEGVRVIFDIKITVLDTRNYSDEEVNQIKFDLRRIISEELVRSKVNGIVDFTNIQNQSLSLLRNQYTFANSDNNSIFDSINVRKISPNVNQDMATSVRSLNLSSSSISETLRQDEVPELGSIDIEVRLVL